MRAIGSRTVGPSRVGEPVAQFAGRPPAEGQHQDRVDRHAVGDPGRRRLDQRGRLAGAGTGQHDQRPAAVLDDRLLRGVEDGRGRRRAGARGRTSR